ncbi:hypothetical protein VitviT2T_006064 [Vitis vinifera]|uniref:Uncharacterized protein n=1 Tax=Vitis vinifera TaxID=29760 RepID=A0ABY9BUS3_VITVI|nr:hypothetical protein VitviT2T_006064 [Vitis vinifera]
MTRIQLFFTLLRIESLSTITWNQDIDSLPCIFQVVFLGEYTVWLCIPQIICRTWLWWPVHIHYLFAQRRASSAGFLKREDGFVKSGILDEDQQYSCFLMEWTNGWSSYGIVAL